MLAAIEEQVFSLLLLIIAYPSVRIAREAMKEGVIHYLPGPFGLSKLRGGTHLVPVVGNHARSVFIRRELGRALGSTPSPGSHR